MKKKERQNIINMIQLTIGISMVSACVIAIIILGLFFLGSKLGIWKILLNLLWFGLVKT